MFRASCGKDKMADNNSTMNKYLEEFLKFVATNPKDFLFYGKAEAYNCMFVFSFGDRDYIKQINVPKLFNAEFYILEINAILVYYFELVVAKVIPLRTNLKVIYL